MPLLQHREQGKVVTPPRDPSSPKLKFLANSGDNFPIYIYIYSHYEEFLNPAKFTCFPNLTKE